MDGTPKDLSPVRFEILLKCYAGDLPQVYRPGCQRSLYAPRYPHIPRQMYVQFRRADVRLDGAALLVAAIGLAATGAAQPTGGVPPASASSGCWSGANSASTSASRWRSIA